MCLKTFGFWVTLGIILDRMGLIKYHALGIFLYPLSEIQERFVEKSKFKKEGSAQSQWIAKELGAQDIDGLHLEEGIHDLDFIKKRFDDGARLFAVLEDKNVIGVCFSTTISCELSSVKIPFLSIPDNTIYTFGAVVADAYKQKGVGTFVMQKVLQTAFEEGKKSAFLAAYLKIEVFRWHLANGYQKWGYLHRITGFGIDCCIKQLASAGRKMRSLLC